jgi:hypothetical protein
VTKVTTNNGTTNNSADNSTPNSNQSPTWIVTQQAINVLTIQEKVSMNTMCTPRILVKYAVNQVTPNFEHYAYPMVHPVTRETISSYKKLMHDPSTADFWKTAFGTDFGGMAQGTAKLVRRAQMECLS